MKDENNNTVGIVAIGRDLRERKELEMELLKSQKLAALGVMAGGYSPRNQKSLGCELFFSSVSVGGGD